MSKLEDLTCAIIVLGEARDTLVEARALHQLGIAVTAEQEQTKIRDAMTKMHYALGMAESVLAPEGW